MLITPSQAATRGISWEKDPPPNKKCEFCGATLEPTGIYLFGKIVMWQPEYIPTRCTCTKAQEYWKRYDLKQAKRKVDEEEKERRRKYIAKIKTLLADSGMKERFKRRTFKTFICNTPKQQECYNIAKRYADEFDINSSKGRGLYFEGTNGTGKTHLAAAIALQLISNEIPVICRTSDDLLSDLKKAYDSREVKEYEVLDAYKNVDLLIIDDLGKEQCTDWSISVLYSIINARYENMKPVIITTNYSSDNLIRAMTPKGMGDTKIRAIVSRLLETSMVVTMAWEDIRRKTL